MAMKMEKIGIVGSGLIGRAWAMLFASQGYKVQLYDILPEQTMHALTEIARELIELEEKKQLRGRLSAVEQLECITITSVLEELVQGAKFIQECIPERLDWKKKLYADLDDLLADDSQTIISSSTSTFMPSQFSEGLINQRNILVSHPLNPPYFIPLVEIVPAPWTQQEALDRTRDLMLSIGQKPVVLRREVRGFATNRIQYAILSEVWHLVADGVLSVPDADAVMSYGLGLRYAHAGPLETAHLNANGISDYFERYGQEIAAVCATLKPPARMQPGEVLSRMAEEYEEILPRKRLVEKCLERREFLSALSVLKSHQEGNEGN